MSKLVIVESPAKAKTIKKYLGKGYEVMASMGHVRDLPKSRLGIDVENNFQPDYIDIRGKGDLRKALKAAAKKSDFVYLATDPDREGEAISWHLAAMLGLDLEQKNRITFNEITKSGIKNGMANPREINQNLVDAQQTRRLLDRLLGYNLSPFLWKKVKKGLSAGRVQSIVVKLIVDRENEIKAFNPEEYWNIDSRYLVNKNSHFSAHLATYKDEKIEIHNKQENDRILAEMDGKEHIVTSVKKGIRKKSPVPPFTTSTMQQEASRRLNFQSKRTMKAAQELYEGVTLPKLGAVGLISYMRTDSLRISDEARKAAADFINQKYGEKYIPEKPRIFKQKNNTQDGHEAIRPTMPEMTPEMVKSSLTDDQYKLYKLVWERFIASQMADCILNTVSVKISCGDYGFRASGHTVEFDGFTAIYEETKDSQEEKSVQLPELNEGEILKLVSLEGSQHFTQPPARYTEASIIKALEENGIGRPSTYAPTLTTVLARNYVERDGKSLVPTALGSVTNQLMEERFANIVNVDFTAKMESDLDRVEEGNVDWHDMLRDFYTDFDASLKKAEKDMEGIHMQVPDEVTDVICDKCGRNMVVKIGRYGKFLACPAYPECVNTKKIVQDTKAVCPICGKRVLAKKSQKGKAYYGCEDNPNCSFMTWDKPLAEKCPECGSSLFKKNVRGGEIHCLKEGCGYVKEKE